MEIKTVQKIRKYATSYVVTVPKPYVDDGNLDLGEEYEVVFRKRSEVRSNEQNATIGVQSYHTYQNGILGNANARTGVTGI